MTGHTQLFWESVSITNVKSRVMLVYGFDRLPRFLPAAHDTHYNKGHVSFPFTLDSHSLKRIGIYQKNECTDGQILQVYYIANDRGKKSSIHKRDGG